MTNAEDTARAEGWAACAAAWEQGWEVGCDYALEMERGSAEEAERRFDRTANPYADPPLHATTMITKD